MSYARRQNESNAYLADVLQRCLRPYQEPRAAYLLPWNWPDFQCFDDKVVAYQGDGLRVSHYFGWVQVCFGVMTCGDSARLR